MSGLSHTPGKRARGKTLRGFESRLLRQILEKIPCKSMTYKGFFSPVRFWMQFFMMANYLIFPKIAPVLRRKCARFVPELCPLLAFLMCPFCAGVS